MPEVKAERPDEPRRRIPLRLHNEDRVAHYRYAARRWLRQPEIYLALLALPIVGLVWAASAVVSVEGIERNLRKGWQAGFAWMTDSTLVRMELDSVEGLARTDREDVAAALHLPRDMSPLEISVDAWRAALEELPWVAEATVRYVPPAGVAARVVEHEPTALWSTEGETWLVGGSGGRIVSASGQAASELPRIAGEGAAAAVGELAALRAALAALAGPETVYRRVGSRRWNVEVEDGPVILLPERNLELAVARLRQLLAHPLPADPGPVTIDLRDPNRIALRLVGEGLERLLAAQPPPGEDV